MAHAFPPNLAGFHDPRLDMWHEVWRRTETSAPLPLPSTPDELQRTQHIIGERLLASIGGLPSFPADFHPAATVIPGTEIPPPASTSATASVSIQPLVFESAPQVRVPAVLYRPPSGNQETKPPAVVFLCGHSPEGKAAPRYQAACYALARAGFLVLSFDPFGQGERLSYLDAAGEPDVPWGTGEHSYAGIPAWWQGSSSVRYFLHDARAAIDVLIDYAGADPSRIGATGNSGGGMLTSLLMALEPRIAAAAPGTFLTTRSTYLYTGMHQDAEQILLGATAGGIDHESFLLATAPRPVCILASHWDFFPIEGARQVYERVQGVYQMLGAADSLELVEAAGPHAYLPEHVAAVVKFFGRHLGGRGEAASDFDDVGVVGTASGVLEPVKLNATTSGQIAIDFPDTRFIPELTQENRDRLARSFEDAADVDKARRWLRARALGGVRAFPTGLSAPWDQPASVTARRLPVDSPHTFLAWPQPGMAAGNPSAQGAGSSSYIWNSGVIPFGQNEPPRTFSTIILLDQGTNDFPQWAQEKNQLNLQETCALVLDVRARGPLLPYAHRVDDQHSHSSSTYKLLTDLIWLGDSLAAGQLFDVLSAIYRWGSQNVQIVGVGYGVYLARLAAFVEPRITELQLEDEYVDPTRYHRHRLWDDGRGQWHGVIPGLEAHAPWPLIVAETQPLT